MKIEIVTPAKHVVTDEAQEIYAVGPRGEYGVLPGHAHYVSPLEIGHLHYLKDGKNHSFVVLEGFMEVLEDTVYILANQVEAAREIDSAVSATRLQEIEKQLAGDSLEPDAFSQLLRERDRCQAQLAASGKN